MVNLEQHNFAPLKRASLSFYVRKLAIPFNPYMHLVSLPTFWGFFARGREEEQRVICKLFLQTLQSFYSEGTSLN